MFVLLCWSLMLLCFIKKYEKIGWKLFSLMMLEEVDKKLSICHLSISSTTENENEAYILKQTYFIWSDLI